MLSSTFDVMVHRSSRTAVLHKVRSPRTKHRRKDSRTSPPAAVFTYHPVGTGCSSVCSHGQVGGIRLAERTSGRTVARFDTANSPDSCPRSRPGGGGAAKINCLPPFRKYSSFSTLRRVKTRGYVQQRRKIV